MDNKLFERDVENNYSCSICLDEDINHELIITTNCSHMFCETCINDWFLQGKYSCPMCRNSIKYYKTNDIETRILPVLTRNTPTINNIPVTRIITNLVHQNTKLRLLLYISFFGIAVSANYYIYLTSDFESLISTYNECEKNLTDTINYYDSFSNLVDVPFYNVHSSTLKVCEVPAFFYNKCFMGN